MDDVTKEARKEREYLGPKDAEHKAVHDAVKSLDSGKVERPARRQLRDALDLADKEGATHSQPKGGIFG